MLFMETSPTKINLLLEIFFRLTPKLLKKNEFTRRTRSL